jgi:hypothetical protein
MFVGLIREDLLGVFDRTPTGSADGLAHAVHAHCIRALNAVATIAAGCAPDGRLAPSPDGRNTSG